MLVSNLIAFGYWKVKSQVRLSGMVIPSCCLRPIQSFFYRDNNMLMITYYHVVFLNTYSRIDAFVLIGVSSD